MNDEQVTIPLVLLKELRYAVELAITSEDGLDGYDGEKLGQKLIPYLGKPKLKEWDYPYENEPVKSWGWVKP